MLTYLTRRQQDAESPADFKFAGFNMMDLFVLLLWLLPAALWEVSILNSDQMASTFPFYFL